MRNKRRAAPSVSHPLGGRTTYVVGLGALSGVRAGFRCGHHLMHQRVVLSAARADGVNLLFHALASAQQPEPAHQADVVCSELADREHAQPAGGEDRQQRAVLELADDARLQALRLEPVIQRLAQGRVPGGKEQM